MTETRNSLIFSWLPIGDSLTAGFTSTYGDVSLFLNFAKMSLPLTIFGIAANITALALFVSPIPTFWRIIKKKSTEEFSALPFACTLLNCLLWTFYGSPWVVDGLLIVTINGVGVVIESVYLLLFFIYAFNKGVRVRLLGYLGTIATFFALVVVLNMLVLHEKSRREIVVGSLAVVLCCLMYASPLSVMKTVVSTKSTEYMPFFLSFFVFVNGSVWIVYSIISHDIFIAIPNTMGSLLGAAQLMLYARYCGRFSSTARVAQHSSDSEEDAKKAPEEVIKANNADLEMGLPQP